MARALSGSSSAPAASSSPARATAAELDRFARLTQGHRRLDARRARQQLEPDLAGRFPSALYFPDEAHMPAPAALAFMLAEVQRRRRRGRLRRRAARRRTRRHDHRLPRARRARRAARPARRARRARCIVRSREIALRRPVQLLHPRHAALHRAVGRRPLHDRRHGDRDARTPARSRCARRSSCWARPTRCIRRSARRRSSTSAPACGPRFPTTCRARSCATAAGASSSTAPTGTASCWRRCWPRAVGRLSSRRAAREPIVVVE